MRLKYLLIADEIRFDFILNLYVHKILKTIISARERASLRPATQHEERSDIKLFYCL